LDIKKVEKKFQNILKFKKYPYFCTTLKKKKKIINLHEIRNDFESSN